MTRMCGSCRRRGVLPMPGMRIVLMACMWIRCCRRSVGVVRVRIRFVHRHRVSAMRVDDRSGGLHMGGMCVVRMLGMGCGRCGQLVARMWIGCIGLRRCSAMRGMQIAGLYRVIPVMAGMRILRGGIAGSQRQGDEQQRAWRRLHGCTLTSRIIPFSMW